MKEGFAMEIVTQTLGQMFRESVRRFRTRDAIVFHGKRCTYGELDLRTDRLAKGLFALGVRRGSHVAVWANNRPATLECYLALWKLGAVLVPVCTGCSAPELSGYLRISDSEYLIFDTGFKTTSFAPIAGAQTVIPRERVLALEDDSSGFQTLDQVRALGEHLSDTCLAGLKQLVQPTDWDCLLFTSGSSGTPHAVATTHFSRVNNARGQAAAIGASASDRYCAALPMHHCFAISGILLSALSTGGCICFPETRHIQSILVTIEQEKCTVLSGVPTLFLAILARPDLKAYQLSSLRTGMLGGSTYPPALFSRICRELNMTLLPSLGQTEATAGFTSGSPDDSEQVRGTTVGRFFPHLEGRIADPATNADCPTGAVGEICVRGYNVMQGYYAGGTLTGQPVDADGWLHTQDLGWLDGDGLLHYSGRIKDVIKRGGEQISPAEVETVLAGLPGVAQAKVIGVPDSHYIEEVCAFVVSGDGQDLAISDLEAGCRRQLAYYKVPRYFLTVKALPLLPNGKPDTRALHAMALNTLRLK